MRAAPCVSVPIHRSPPGAILRLCTGKLSSPATFFHEMRNCRRVPPNSPPSVATQTDPSARGRISYPKSLGSPLPGGSLSPFPLPGPPNQSIESAAGPRRLSRLLREGQRIGRSSASLSRPGSATHRVTEAESALRHRLRYVPSRCLERAHLAFEI